MSTGGKEGAPQFDRNVLLYPQPGAPTPSFTHEEIKTFLKNDREFDLDSVINAGENILAYRIFHASTAVEYHLHVWNSEGRIIQVREPDTGNSAITIVEPEVSADGKTYLMIRSIQPGEVVYIEMNYEYDELGRLKKSVRNRIQSEHSVIMVDERKYTYGENNSYLLERESYDYVYGRTRTETWESPGYKEIPSED